MIEPKATKINKLRKKLQPIKIKKLKIRGDEIAILFFSLLFLIFLGVSFFRLFAVGKLFDDFIFLFLFGWTKYLVYLTLFGLTIPICFNYYFKIKLSFVFAVVASFITISWLVSNINLILLNDNQIWLTFSHYNFASLNNYFDNWWASTIINNYHGFFAHPMSFNDWTNVNSYFPTFAAGGIISNFLIVITNYGSFTTNLILNVLFLIISLTWIIFNKPWLFFTTLFFFIKPLINYIQKRNIQRISQKSLRQKQLVLQDNAKVSTDQNKKNSDKAQTIKNVLDVKEPQEPKEIIVKPKVVKEDPAELTPTKPNKQELLIHKVLKESGNLTPFGQVHQDPTQKIDITSNEVDESKS